MTTVNTLVQRTRRFLGDWPSNDTITASLSSSGTSMSVATASDYFKGWLLEIDSEVLKVATSATTGTSVSILRGQYGTTAATHASSATVLVRPEFTQIEILDQLNAGLKAVWPYIYQDILDTSLTTVADTYEYTVPSVSSSITYIPRIYGIDLKRSGETNYKPIRRWEIRRGSTPKIMFPADLDAGGTLRVRGYAPFDDLALADSLPSAFPIQSEELLPLYAAQALLTSGEARRARVNTLPQDAREQANKPGASMAAANSLYQRFQQRLMATAMSPMSKHVRKVF